MKIQPVQKMTRAGQRTRMKARGDERSCRCQLPPSPLCRGSSLRVLSHLASLSTSLPAATQACLCVGDSNGHIGLVSERMGGGSRVGPGCC